MNWFFDFLNFVPGRHGLPGLQVDKVKTMNDDSKPENVTFLASGRAATIDKGNDTWDIWNNDQRSAELTKEDLKRVTLPGIKEDKYRAIKAKWASKMSIKEASQALTGERGKGYRQRTISKYYSLINSAADPSPTKTVDKEGGGSSILRQKREQLLHNVEY